MIGFLICVRAVSIYKGWSLGFYWINFWSIKLSLSPSPHLLSSFSFFPCPKVGCSLFHMFRRSFGDLEIKDQGEEEDDYRSRSWLVVKIQRVDQNLQGQGSSWEEKSHTRRKSSRSILVDTRRGRIRVWLNFLRIRDHQ